MTDPTSDNRAASDNNAGSDNSAVDPPDLKGKPSGLRNPPAAVRGVGAAALVIEAIVLLLALAPMHILHIRSAGTAIAVLIALAFVCVLLAGALRRSWAWWAVFVPQAALIACGYFHVVLGILGVLFTLLWVYVLYVRRTVLGK